MLFRSPSVMSKLISTHVEELRDESLYEAMKDLEWEHREDLHSVHNQWGQASKYARKLDSGEYEPIFWEDTEEEDEDDD